jgi:WD40 repeat protein
VLQHGHSPCSALGQALGRYKLLERIGEGGCGVVYVAGQTLPVRRRIATVSDDGKANLWEAVSGRELLTLKGHRDGVFAVAFSPDGHRIGVGSDDGTAKVWAAATPEQVAAWQREERAAAEHLATLKRDRKAEQEGQKRDCSWIPCTRNSCSGWRWKSRRPLCSAIGSLAP